MAPLSVVQPTKSLVLAKVLEAPAMGKVLATVPDKVCRRSPGTAVDFTQNPDPNTTLGGAAKAV